MEGILTRIEDVEEDVEGGVVEVTGEGVAGRSR